MCFYYFQFFFRCCIKFLQQNINQSETGIRGRKLSVEMYVSALFELKYSLLLLSRFHFTLYKKQHVRLLSMRCYCILLLNWDIRLPSLRGFHIGHWKIGLGLILGSIRCFSWLLQDWDITTYELYIFSSLIFPTFFVYIFYIVLTIKLKVHTFLWIRNWRESYLIKYLHNRNNHFFHHPMKMRYVSWLRNVFLSLYN